MSRATPQGRLIAVVGPSGVGKDSVMEGLAATPGFALVRRVITRPSEAGGEAFDGVTQKAFDRMAGQGAFALHWQAHGLSYGIPAAETARLAQGTDLLVNLSRAVLVEASRRFPGLIVLNLTAAPEVLAARLAARGRETPQDIARRLARADLALPQGLDIRTVDNGGALPDTIRAARAVLDPQQEPLDAPR